MPRDNNEGRIVRKDKWPGEVDKNRTDVSKKNLDNESETDRPLKKPGSQSNSSKRHNNGRGGGK